MENFQPHQPLGRRALPLSKYSVGIFPLLARLVCWRARDDLNSYLYIYLCVQIKMGIRYEIPAYPSVFTKGESREMWVRGLDRKRNEKNPPPLVAQLMKMWGNFPFFHRNSYPLSLCSFWCKIPEHIVPFLITLINLISGGFKINTNFWGFPFLFAGIFLRNQARAGVKMIFPM